MLGLGSGLLAIVSAFARISAWAARLVPPGNSGVNQYTEVLPTADGESLPGTALQRTPAHALDPGNARAGLRRPRGGGRHCAPPVILAAPAGSVAFVWRRNRRATAVFSSR